ncbi:MAG: hypothetical protein ACOX2V_09330 [Clostridia bacterium]
MKYVKNQYGGYWDYCDFPLLDVDDEVIYNYPFPNPDDFDYDFISKGWIIFAIWDLPFPPEMPEVGDIMNTTGMLMGVEQALINICIDHEATLHMIDKRLNMQLKRLERVLELCKGKT